MRVFELYRAFPNNPPVINGLKFKESWQQGFADYIDSNGLATGYTVTTMENGDKFFSRGTSVVQNAGDGKLTATGISIITGGTGKLAGIHGTIRAVTQTDLKANTNEGQVEIEYWMDK